MPLRPMSRRASACPRRRPAAPTGLTVTFTCSGSPTPPTHAGSKARIPRPTPDVGDTNILYSYLHGIQSLATRSLLRYRLRHGPGHQRGFRLGGDGSVDRAEKQLGS